MSVYEFFYNALGRDNSLDAGIKTIILIIIVFMRSSPKHWLKKNSCPQWLHPDA